MLQLEIQFSPKTKIIRKCNFHFLFITVPRQSYTQCVNLHTVCKITHMIKVCKNLKCCPVSLLIVINAFVIVFVFVFLWSTCLLITLFKCLRGQKSLGLLSEGILLSFLDRSCPLITLIKCF